MKDERVVPITRHENIDSRPRSERGRDTVIPDQTIARVRAYPYSPVVGTGVQLFNKGGEVIGQLSLIGVVGGPQEAINMAGQVANLMQAGLVRRDAPLWLTDAAVDKITPEDAAKRDAKEVADEFRDEIGKRISGLLFVALFVALFVGAYSAV